jgi:hypothetical protein
MRENTLIFVHILDSFENTYICPNPKMSVECSHFDSLATKSESFSTTATCKHNSEQRASTISLTTLIKGPIHHDDPYPPPGYPGHLCSFELGSSRAAKPPAKCSAILSAISVYASNIPTK